MRGTPVGAPTGMVDPVLWLVLALLQFSKKLSSQGNGPAIPKAVGLGRPS